MMQANRWIFAAVTIALGAEASLLYAADAAPAESGGAGRLPALPITWEIRADGGKRPRIVMDETSTAEALVAGNLLVPLEESPASRRPDLLFACHSGHLHIFDASHHAELTKPQVRDFTGLAAEEGIALPDESPAVLLGCAGDVAVILQDGAAVGIDLKKYEIAWRIPPDADAAGAQAADVSAGGRGPIPFGISGGKLVRIDGDKVFATDIATGKPDWADASGKALAVDLPDGKSSIVCGDGKFIVVRTHPLAQDGVRFVVIDAAARKIARDISATIQEEPHVVLDGSTLIVASRRAITAYDLAGHDDKPLWRREDVQSQFSEAAVVSPGGVVVARHENELLCLSGKDGQTLWPARGGAPIYLQQRISPDQPVFLRSMICDDVVFFQSAAAIEAYDASGEAPGRLLWKTPESEPGDNPPMQSMQLSDHFVVALESGPCQGARNKVNLRIYERGGGKLLLQKVLQRNEATSEGPAIAAWQVVDGGIAMETKDAVYLYRFKTP